MDWQEDEQVVVNGRDYQALDEIERLTKMFIILKSGRKVNRRSCHNVGDTFYYYSIEKATPELVAKIQERMKRYKLRETIKNFDYRKLTTEQLEKIVAIIEEKTNEKS